MILAPAVYMEETDLLQMQQLQVPQGEDGPRREP